MSRFFSLEPSGVSENVPVLSKSILVLPNSLINFGSKSTKFFAAVFNGSIFSSISSTMSSIVDNIVLLKLKLIETAQKLQQSYYLLAFDITHVMHENFEFHFLN